MKYLVVGVSLGALLLSAPDAEAQLGKVLREGAEAVGKQVFQKGAKEAAQESAEAATAGGLRSIVRKSLAESTTTIAQKSVGSLGDDVARAAARHGEAVVAPLVSRFGDDGAKALSKLSPTNARRVAMMTDDLAATGKGTEFMQVLAARGDVAAEWIWKHKGTLAAGTVAVAFLANPDPFLAHGGEVTTTLVETAGKEVARPLIEKTIEGMTVSVTAATPALIASVIAPAAARVPWLECLLLGLAATVIWIGWRWEAWRLGQQLWNALFKQAAA